MAARCGRRIEDRQARDVACLAGALERQELRVNAGQLPHNGLPVVEFARILVWRAS
jgi:hypothetical protein